MAASTRTMPPVSGVDYPASAKVFTEMAEEENLHRRWLIDLFRQKFGDHIPLIRRQDVSGLVRHDPIWTVRPAGPRESAAASRSHRDRDAQFLPIRP